MKRQNVAGGGVRMMAEERRVRWLWLALTGLICLGVILGINWINLRALKSPIIKIVTSLVCIAGLVAVDRRIIPRLDVLDKRENDAIRGAEAEEAVGAILDRLPDNYMVLHDVPGFCGNIDHVVLRKDGAVFVIETKSTGGRVTERKGQLMINGKAPEKDFIGQTLRNAMQVQNKLAIELGISPWVNAALVFTQAYVSVRGELGRVRVVNVRFLLEWMARAPGQAEVARLVAMKCERVRSVLQSEQSPMQNEMDLAAKNAGQRSGNQRIQPRTPSRSGHH